MPFRFSMGFLPEMMMIGGGGADDMTVCPPNELKKGRYWIGKGGGEWMSVFIHICIRLETMDITPCIPFENFPPSTNTILYIHIYLLDSQKKNW